MNFVQQHYFAQAVSQENDSQSSPAYPWIILVVTHTHTHTQVTRSMRKKLQNSTRNVHIQTQNKSVSNWILTSFQPHRVISGWSNCHKQHTHTHNPQHQKNTIALAAIGFLPEKITWNKLVAKSKFQASKSCVNTMQSENVQTVDLPGPQMT